LEVMKFGGELAVRGHVFFKMKEKRPLLKNPGKMLKWKEGRPLC